MKNGKQIVARIMTGVLSVLLTSGNLLTPVLGAGVSDSASSIEVGEASTEINSEPVEEYMPGSGASEESVDNAESEVPIAEENDNETLYTVTLDANGGLFENEWDDVLGEFIESTETINKVISEGMSVSTIPVMVKDDMTASFLGWSYERNGEPVFCEYDEYMPTESCVLYAVWGFEETGSVDNFDEVETDLDVQESEPDYTEGAEDPGDEADLPQHDVEESPSQDSRMMQEDSDIEEFDQEDKRENIDDGSEDKEAAPSDESTVEEGKKKESITETKPETDKNSTGDQPLLIEPAKEEFASSEGMNDNVSGQDTSEIIDSGSYSENIQWTLRSSGTLYISGSGWMDSMFYLDIPWNQYNKQITSCVVEEGVESVCSYALYQCMDVTSVTLPSSVRGIGSSAFYSCRSLTNIVLPEALESVGEDAFYDCRNLISIMIPGNVEYINRFAFLCCDNLKEISVSSSNEKYCSVDGMLLSKDKTDLICCPGGKEGNINIPSSVEYIEQRAFYSCEKVTGVTIPSGVTTIHELTFQQCYGLESVSLPDSITKIESHAFESCHALTELRLPSSLEYIGEYAFYLCRNLTEIEIPAATTKICDGALAEGWSLENITVQSGNPNYVSVDGVLFNSDRTVILACPGGKTGEYEIPSTVVEIADHALHGCRELKQIIIPDSVTKIGDSSFAFCESWSEIVIPDSVLEIENNAFNYCKSAESLSLSAGMTTVSNYCFGNCMHISTIMVPASISSIEYSAFGTCRSLADIFFEGTEDAWNQITISSDNNYFKNATVHFGMDIAGVKISLSESTFMYDGNAKTPDVTICGLKEGRDFTVSYSNNIDAGIATVTVTGTGKFKGTATKTFEIANLFIYEAVASKISDQIYTGSAITPPIVVKIGSRELVKGTDYTVSYKDNIETGYATVVISGKGNYKGSLYKGFMIIPAPQQIKAKSSGSSIPVGKTATVSITGNKGRKTYTSSNNTIATVNASGVVTAKKVGTVTITAASEATSNYEAASCAVKIKVTPAATSSITTVNQATGIKLTWKKVAGATGYKVYRSSTLVKTITSGAVVTFTDTKANANGAKYTFKIVPTASTGNGAGRSASTYRISRPAVKTVKNTAAKIMTVTWAKNAKASGYQVQYSTSKTFSQGNKTATISKAAILSKRIGGLVKGKLYYVRIRTYKTVGNTKYYSAWSPARSIRITK